MKVNVAKFKAHLSHYLRSIQKGGEVVITDRKLPVARVIPFQETHPAHLEIQKAEDPSRLARQRFPPLKGAPTDSLSFLLEERRSER